MCICKKEEKIIIKKEKRTQNYVSKLCKKFLLAGNFL